jgi:hypothetical protein
MLERSPFYRRFHSGLEGRPLSELPVLTKAQLMESFGELVTDPEMGSPSFGGDDSQEARRFDRAERKSFWG